MKKKKRNEAFSFAMETLGEIKQQSIRWFIIAIIELIIIIATNTGWLIYESQFETITEEEQTIEDIDNSSNSNYTQTIN